MQAELRIFRMFVNISVNILSSCDFKQKTCRMREINVSWSFNFWYTEIWILILDYSCRCKKPRVNLN